jgi:hypothetical protein
MFQGTYRTEIQWNCLPFASPVTLSTDEETSVFVAPVKAQLSLTVLIGKYTKHKELPVKTLFSKRMLGHFNTVSRLTSE